MQSGRTPKRLTSLAMFVAAYFPLGTIFITSLGRFNFSDWRDVAATLIVLALMFALAYRVEPVGDAASGRVPESYVSTRP